MYTDHWEVLIAFSYFRLSKRAGLKSRLVPDSRFQILLECCVPQYVSSRGRFSFSRLFRAVHTPPSGLYTWFHSVTHLRAPSLSHRWNTCTPPLPSGSTSFPVCFQTLKFLRLVFIMPGTCWGHTRVWKRATKRCLLLCDTEKCVQLHSVSIVNSVFFFF